MKTHMVTTVKSRIPCFEYEVTLDIPLDSIDSIRPVDAYECLTPYPKYPKLMERPKGWRGLFWAKPEPYDSLGFPNREYFFFVREGLFKAHRVSFKDDYHNFPILVSDESGLYEAWKKHIKAK